MPSKKLFSLVVFLFLLAAAAGSVTLDELLASYDWNVNNQNIVNSVNYKNIDSNSNGKFDTILFNISVTANGNLKYMGFMGESSFESSKTASGSDNLIINFSSSDFDGGYYNFSFKILNSSNNILVEARNNVSYYFNSSLHEPPYVIPAFNNFFAQDTDSDLLYELLSCNLTFNVNKSGNYKAILYLKDNKTTVLSSNNLSLAGGITNRNLSFLSKGIRAARLDGAVTLDSIEIVGIDTRFDRLFAINSQTNINKSDFDPDTSIIIGNFIDKGIDTDSDGLYNLAQLNLTAYFNETSTYSIIGSMDDYYGEHVMDFNYTQAFTNGTKTVSINLNGTDIWKTKVNGPYKISYLKIAKGDAEQDIALNPYSLQNSTYYTDFDQLPLPDLQVSFYELRKLNNYSDVKVKVENKGEKSALMANVELYNNRTDLLDSRSAYFLMPGSYKILEFPRVYTEDTNTLTAFVDISDLVEESNETNNLAKANTTLDIIMNYNATAGFAPLAVAFSSTVNRGNSQFSFYWDFGDFTNSNSQNTMKIFPAGNYFIELLVSDILGLKAKRNVTITVSQSAQPDTKPPSSATNLAAPTKGVSWIYWSWTNPSDPDFSSCILYLNNINIANTTNSYYNSTSLAENTTYELRIQTIDTSKNINSSLVSLQIKTLAQGQTNTTTNTTNTTTNTTNTTVVDISKIKLDKYWIYGQKNSPISFDARWYYPEAGISSVSWDFGDSSASATPVTSHSYANTGSYTVLLTINSAITETITVFVTENPDYNFESKFAYFTDKGPNYEITAAAFGNDAINGFITDYDDLRVYAIVKISGDSDITTDQALIETYEAKNCWSIGGSYFKCYVYQQKVYDVVNANSSFNFKLKNDAGIVLSNLNMFDVTETQGPNISLAVPVIYKTYGSFGFNYDLTDLSSLNMIGSGIGKLDIYSNGVYVETVKVDSASYSGSYTFTPAAVSDGEEKSYNVCFNAYDRTRLNNTKCSSVALDKKSPALNSLNIVESIASVPRNGVSVTVKANISDISDVSAYVDFSNINIDNPAGYSNKQADSCIKQGNYWICAWNNIMIKLTDGGDYSITVYSADILGNSGKNTVTKTIGIANSAPVLTVNNIAANEGDLIDINPSATDSDGDTVTYSYSGWMNSKTYQTNYQDSGSHTVTVTASDGRGGSDSKTITATVNNVQLPDLKIKSISYKPNAPAANQLIMLNFIIINSGEARAQDIAWQIEDQQATVTQQQNTFSLNAGEEMNVNALIRYTSSGNYNPLIKIDPSNSIKELDESNNQAGLQLTIS